MTSTANAPLELAVYDRVLRASSAAPSPDVIIVGIDAASLEKLGEWPWPRDVHATLLNRLNADGARVVTFTMPFGNSQRLSELERMRGALALLDASDLGRSEQAEALRRQLGSAATGSIPQTPLADALGARSNVVLPIELRTPDGAPGWPGASGVPASVLIPAKAAALGNAVSAVALQVPAPEFLDAAGAAGHTYMRSDADGVVRTDTAAVRIGDALLPSLALATAARAQGLSPAQLSLDTARTLRIGDDAVVLDDALTTRPHYFPVDGQQGFARYSYWQVISGEVPHAQLRDKIVVVGFIDTPLAAPGELTTPLGASVPAVVAVASATSSLIDERMYMRPAFAQAIEWAVAIAVVLFAAFALPASGLAIGALATVLVVAIIVISEIGLLQSLHVWARLMLPCVAVLAGLALYTVGELIRRANTRAQPAGDATSNLRALGQTFQKQGQLDLAFETYQRCPLDAPTMELLYYLGMDFERRRQLPKAAAVYSYIATRDPNYRDLRTRRARVNDDAAPRCEEPTAAVALSPLRRAPPRPARRTEAADRRVGEATPPTRTLGRYEIDRELGKGAMGVVYLGRDPKINRIVAIKAIPLAEEFQGDDLAEARARFFREAEMAGRLNHPSIVTVYDAGEDQGLAYIAMEYLRGQHLSHYTDTKRLLSPRTVMLLTARVADALHYAHRQNVVHRDIKPANIMFNPDTDELKITDFGIARLTDTSRTKTGIVLGTPSFMSPEQLEGRPLDGRSDQFALGISLYHLLCGQLPFRAESMPRLMHKIATEPHPPIRVLRPELPTCVEAIIDRALAKSPDDRYPSCGEMAAALRSCAPPEGRGNDADDMLVF